mmetsp:Transcript_50243/g.140785  ORF Transcript_50243/g.140785 Transcript_50243/m.140785 type:complete len:279 (+) Transcript_50243:652-1488(+)
MLLRDELVELGHGRVRILVNLVERDMPIQVLIELGPEVFDAALEANIPHRLAELHVGNAALTAGIQATSPRVRDCAILLEQLPLHCGHVPDVLVARHLLLPQLLQLCLGLWVVAIRVERGLVTGLGVEVHEREALATRLVQQKLEQFLRVALVPQGLANKVELRLVQPASLVGVELLPRLCKTSVGLDSKSPELAYCVVRFRVEFLQRDVIVAVPVELGPRIFELPDETHVLHRPAKLEEGYAALTARVQSVFPSGCNRPIPVHEEPLEALDIRRAHV